MVHNPLSADGRLPPLSGLVLSGGYSKRMGTDKAALEYAGECQLQRAMVLLDGLIDDVFVSLRPDQQDDPVRGGFRQIPDLHSQSGPGAGILAAHAYNPQSAWLVIACDMPLVDAQLLRQLIQGRRPESGITAFRVPGDKPEPLCAVYEPDVLAGFALNAEDGKVNGPRAMFDTAKVTLLEPDHAEALQGANTPQEFEKLQSLEAAEKIKN